MTPCGIYQNIFLVIVAVFLLCSCGAGRKVQPSIESLDSVRIEVRTKTVYRDSLVYIEIPSQSAQNTTRDTSSHLETDFAESDARINSDGTLYHSLRNKEQLLPKPIKIPQEKRDSTIYKNRWYKVTYPVEKELTSWQKWQMRGFWILLSLSFIYIMRKPLKWLLKVVAMR